MFGLVERIFGIDVRKRQMPKFGIRMLAFFKVFDSTSGKHIASFSWIAYSRARLNKQSLDGHLRWKK
jgi:Zn-dependent oligopeptidase